MIALIAQATDPANTGLILDASFVTLILGTLVPLVVGVLTKLNASSAIKSISMIVLNAIVALITLSQVGDGSAVFTKEGFIAFATGLIASVAAYLGVWKPIGISGAINEKTAGFGIGKAA